ncbi:class I SAM-dependent methyltransferase [Ottowia thiooxydans]|uniref:class I SAM-dependent methyltransferase n=1 Tax=Ottowia thiooxydans TaxID=219182 RepID=UPI000427BCB2|nr:class I SAM-dependent methyltransferase [Ottowia thiooxydans]
MNEVHVAAQEGYSKQAQAYSRGRPDYPAELGNWLKETLHLGPGRKVADVGAGTGKFTPLLTATGADVSAVEPVDAMREKIASAQPNVRTLAGTAQSIPLAASSLDAIVCAQAFHWFANRETMDEFARVLKPGASLGLVWNVRDESVDWVAELTNIMTPYEGDAPRFYKGDWRRAFPHHAFSPLQETRFEHAHIGSPQQVILDRVMSVSFIATLPEQEQASVRGRVESLIASHPELKGREVVRVPYQTQAYYCGRI